MRHRHIERGVLLVDGSCAILGGLAGDRSDEDLLLEQDFFTSFGESKPPVYRGELKHVLTALLGMEAIFGEDRNPIFVGDQNQAVPTPAIYALGAKPEWRDVIRLHDIETSERGRGNPPPVIEAIRKACASPQQVANIRVLRDPKTRKFLGTKVLGYSVSPNPTLEPFEVEGAILPQWNPNSRNGGRRAVALFLGEGGRRVLESCGHLLLGKVEQVR